MSNGWEEYCLWLRITLSAFMLFYCIGGWRIGRRKKAHSVDIFLYWTSIFYFPGTLIYPYFTYGHFIPTSIPMVLLALFFVLFDLWLIEGKKYELLVLKKLAAMKALYAMVLLVGPFWP